MDECYEKAGSGTHVAFSTCTDEELSAAYRWNLVPSDRFGIMPQVSAMHIWNPLRYAHRRVLLAIAEGGLDVPHKMAALPLNHGKSEETEPFIFYFQIYLSGGARCRHSFLLESYVRSLVSEDVTVES
ncbi:hypothetical protein MTO96_044524 [Rhipicephalus appendiculatus]